MNGCLRVTAGGLDEAYFLDLLGDASSCLGRYEEAIEAYGRAVRMFSEHEARYAYALGLFKLARSYLALGRGSEAARYLRECLPIFGDLNMRAAQDRALEALGACAAAT
jgi:tetratricopeptide (TPR) repeat protein